MAIKGVRVIDTPFHCNQFLYVMFIEAIKFYITILIYIILQFKDEEKTHQFLSRELKFTCLPSCTYTIDLVCIMRKNNIKLCK